MGAIFQAVLSAATAVVMLMAAADAACQQQVRQREQVQQRTQEHAGKREIIPGSELMSTSEREDYRRRYAAANTDAERDKVRAEHVNAMEGRARLRGLRLAQPVSPKGDGK
jgi:hypothetical protein